MVKAYLISTGTELLLGSTLDTNSIFLSRKLAEIGVKVIGKSVVGDNPDSIAMALRMGLAAADMVITTGGLGPTRDDLTKEIACEVAGVDMKLIEAEEERLRDYFQRRHRAMPEINLKQAMFPEQATIITNHFGTAPGMYLPLKNNQVIICLPGPPREAEPMYENYVKDLLIKTYNLTDRRSASRIIRIFGPGESQVEEMLQEVMDQAHNYNLALLASEGEINVRVTAEGKDYNESVVILTKVTEQISQIMGKSVFGYDDDTLSAVVGKLLDNRNRSLAVAESCTGGFLGKMITDIPGSSKYFWGGVITYSNQAKENLLGVRSATLQEYGAVSRETALEMAWGVKRLAGTDIGISITGIAGPEGGSEEKPVGLVYIALVGDNLEQVREMHFVGNRNGIRTLSAKSALDLLRLQLL
ncbi:MAG TPA: competence/damage-inducible protein A [Syntrophomonadaceae bacterium]|nr:competence/damage-inducible protein A [Syntrophomonadaceae bacterium]HQE22512.1 competence/damage-inducible protein A [Syntrophomonadaceae bacterium]